MSGSILLQFVINGLYISCTYVLVALGLSLIFGVLDIADFAQGSLFMVGAYVCYYGMKFIGVPYFLSLAFSLLIAALLGNINNILVYRPLRGTVGANTLVAALGIFTIVQNLGLFIFGSEYTTVSSPFGKSKFSFHSVFITQHRAFVIIATFMLIFLTWLFLYKTKWGKGLRAMSQNREAATLVGVNIDKISFIAFGLAAGLAGVSGALIAPVEPFTPTLGGDVILKAFAAVVFGGMGSLIGPVIGAFIIGITETVAVAFISSAYSSLIAFGLMIMILFVRPQGLLGEKV